MSGDHLPKIDWAAIDRVINEPNDDFVSLVKCAGLDPSIDFRFADLRGMKFGICELAGFDFTGADLTNADLGEADETGAIFVGARMEGARRRLVQVAEDPEEFDGNSQSVFEPETEEDDEYGQPEAWEIAAYGQMQPQQAFVMEETASFEPHSEPSSSDENRPRKLAPYKLIVTLKGHERYVQSAAFSADGGRIVSAGSDGTVRIWDAQNHQPIATLKGHEDWVRSAAFSADGGRIVSAGDDGRLCIWDAQNHQPIATLKGHQGIVWSAAFSADGGRIVSAGRDGTVRIWSA